MNAIVTDISGCKLHVKANFAHLNKNNSVSHYRKEISDGKYDRLDCMITHVVCLSVEDYDTFADSLLTDREWLREQGGTFADMEPEPTGHFWEWSEAQQAEFRRTCYRHVIAVNAPQRDTLYIDPQGYNYARYVGL